MTEREVLRHIINGCDESLKEVFLRRMEMSLNMAKYKLGADIPIYDRSREQEILEKVSFGLSPELGRKAQVLWKTLLRMSRGRQYNYFIKNNPSLKLSHENDIADCLPAGPVYCPEYIAGHVTGELGFEAVSVPSPEEAVKALLDKKAAMAAVELSRIFEADWLYSIIYDKPVYVNSFTPTRDGKIIALMSDRLVLSEGNNLVTLAFAIHTEQGSLAQALSILSDFQINLEYMQLKTQNIYADSERHVNIIFAGLSGDLLSVDMRSALFQMQTELPAMRVMGYRKSL